jgi:outer membrane lipoprotein-sorting protein
MQNKKEKIDETINGTLYLKKEKYKLEFSDQIIICDGKTTWTYLKDVNEVQINSVVETEEEITPQNIFNLYEKGHRNKYIREGEEKGKKVHVIELVPIEQKQYFKVRLNIDKTTNQLISAVVFDRNSTTFTYELTKTTPDITLTDDKFTFKASSYPKVEIIDLR